MWITTGHKPSAQLLEQIPLWKERIGATYVERKSYSIRTLMNTHNMEQMLVLAEDQPRLYVRGYDKPYFFHPGMSVLRIKSMLKGDNDVMIEVAELKKGDAFLDCTLGLAADAITASYIVGEGGKVVGIESVPLIAELTKWGLQHWQQDDVAHFDAALRRIKVISANHYDYLKQLPDESFDVVYFDPMFRLPVSESVGIASLRTVANTSALQDRVIKEALRVSRRKVMMKERTDSTEFERLGFKKVERPNSSITFGVIDK